MLTQTYLVMHNMDNINVYCLGFDLIALALLLSFPLGEIMLNSHQAGINSEPTLEAMNSRIVFWRAVWQQACGAGTSRVPSA